MAHHNISLRFRVRGRRIKNFHVSQIGMSARKFFCRPAADSILMPPTFHIDNLNRYTQSFQGSQEADLESMVCPPGPSKVG